MAYSVQAINAAKDILLALIGAAVFVFGIVHQVPLTTNAVEYVGLFGAYYGVHVYSSASVSKSGVQLKQ